MTDSQIEFITELEAIIASRAKADASESYTARLVAEGSKRVAQKVGEESVELALAAVTEDRAEMLEEAADLVYHLLVLLHINQAELSDVAAVLRRRHAS
jgi:phosphoribosyl-ATP pyrophosphohydrolase/phosphoribosyl-AMP cyclohydrolase